MRYSSANFAPNNPETYTNLTDAASASFTATYPTSSQVQIALSTTARLFAFSTGNTVSGSAVRGSLTQTIVVATGNNANAGFSLFDGVNRTNVTYQGVGRINVTGTGTPSGNLSTTMPTLVAGDVIVWQLTSLSTGELYFNVSKNGGAPYFFAMTGTVQGSFWTAMQSNSGTTTVLHSASFDTYASYTPPAIPSPYNGALTGTTLSRPSGFGSAVPSAVKVAFGGSKFSANVLLVQPLSKSDLRVGYLLVSPTGSDSNPGTPAFPLRSINTAISRFKGGLGIVEVVGGTIYDQSTSWNSAASGATVLQVVASDSRRVVSSMHDAGLTWASVDGTTYSATFANGVVNVFDAANLTSDGDYSRVALATSLANCQATAGSYFVTGTTIYVHASDGRAPDTNILVYKKAGSGTANDYNGQYPTDNGFVYVEGIDFEGGVYPFYTRVTSSSVNQTLHHLNCSFKYAGANCLAVNGNTYAIGQNSVAAWGTSDGFNYHAIFGSAGPQFVEVNCVGRRNGNDASDANNGSTSHEASSGIRLNGDYRFNQDRCVCDVGSSFSWNLGCVSGNSLTGNAAFSVGNATGDTTKMWLDHCTSGGGPDLETQFSGTIYTASFTGTGSNVGTPNVQAYTP